MNQRIFSSSIFWYIILIASFFAFGFYAFQSTYLLQKEEHAQEEQQAREHLETLIQVWESAIFARANSWLEELQEEENIEALERRWRRSNPWFDAVYVWDRNSFRYPKSQTTSRITLPPNCTLKQEEEDPFRSPNCQPPFSSYEISNALSLQLGSQLLEEGKKEEALRTLTTWNPKPDSGITETSQKFNKSVFIQRSLRALEIDPQSISITVFADNLLQLDAPTLETLPELTPFPIRDPNLILVLDRIQRRRSAYNEIDENLRRTTLPKELQVHADPYGSSPYLLITKRQKIGLGSAIQIDPFLLLTEIFQQETPTAIRPVVLDAQDNLLLGQFSALQKEEEIWVRISCGRLFPHLRAAYIRPKKQTTPFQIGTWSLFLPLIISAIIAGLAILGSVQAERKQREFIERQQAFVARITHELKTPLAGIRLMAESLQLGILQSPEQATQFTERIISETDRLERRIDEVLEGTRKAQLKKKVPIDGKKLIEDLYKEWHQRFEEVGGILRVESIGNTRLMADKMLLIDALKNLLSNAIKYRREDRPLRSILQVSEKKSYIEFSVADNGLGVPVIYRKSIFQRFVRVEGPHRGLAGGHGLGLTFVEETAQAHKGSIRCVDGILGGTKFVLRIPKR
jgi:signal transduction histidine kinase